ncbi:hypothetical protein BG842_09005 [Haladaptatus sp. W1]|uniref:DUF2240 family protein n=1 Tax=Haladaptatus sp. W1 TaxID=1897478 RepID=UPI000849BC0A|nr:DUF2240 family protein [Haladaptatus sp. W1]ODR83452.1 hypothetical protein BG842_09005 [Haladaptatus sp. W1]
MSLRIAVAAPFQQKGRERMRESEFVVSLSLDRDWFSPDQAKRLVDVASGQGLLSHEDDELIAEFDPASVEIPDDFVPDESLLQEQSTFEKVLDKVVSHGTTKQTAVAEINELQAEVAVSVEAAAVVYARRKGIDVSDEAREALADLKA